MQIGRVLVSRYSIPLPRPVCDATHGMIASFSLIVVRIQTRDGIEGIGFTYTVGTGGGSAIASMIADDLAPLVANKDPRRVQSLWKLMWRSTHYVGAGGIASFAISAMDIALWDIKAKACQEPLWRFLGGSDPRTPAYFSGIDLDLNLPELEAQYDNGLRRGFRAIKMKVGRDRLREDLQRVQAIRELIGQDTPLMVDANMKWSVEEAIRASHKLAELDVFWLEEPTAPSDVQGHVRIQREGALPLAAGENLRALGDFQRLISAGGVAFPEPDATNCGGITVWMKVASLAEAHNLPVTSHGVHDLHVSLLAAVPNASYLEVHGFELDNYVWNPMTLTSGFGRASERPGHGIEFQWNELKRHHQP